MLKKIKQCCSIGGSFFGCASAAYATEEILLVLVAAGSSGLGLSLPIAVAIILLLAIVVLSYRQTIRAYPQGGGSYIRENLVYPGLVAGGYDRLYPHSDVSISAGTAALTSAIPLLQSSLRFLLFSC